MNWAYFFHVIVVEKRLARRYNGCGAETAIIYKRSGITL